MEVTSGAGVTVCEIYMHCHDVYLYMATDQDIFCLVPDSCRTGV